ncbi:MAG: hypothetical protein AAGD06_04895 [Acidobacteriota bacterium]
MAAERKTLLRTLGPILALLCLVFTSTAAEAEFLIESQPTVPLVGDPFQLVVSGQWPFFPSGTDPRPGVEVDGDVLRLVLQVRRLGTEIPFAFTADVPPLAAVGPYRLEIRTVDAFGTEELQHQAELGVFRGRLMVRPSEPVVTSSEPFRLTFEQVPICDDFEGPVVVEDGIIRVPLRIGACPLLPQIVDLETPDIGPLPAGEYTVIVPLEPDQPARWLNVRHRSKLTVLPDPVPLADGRFEVEVVWRDDAGSTGRGVLARPPSEDSALFWFFERENWELMVKVLDGCAINQHHWVFSGATTDVEHTLTVRDTVTGAVRTYTNPLGTASPAVNDTAAFPCEDPPAGTGG